MRHSDYRFENVRPSLKVFNIETRVQAKVVVGQLANRLLLKLEVRGSNTVNDKNLPTTVQKTK